MQKEEEEEEEQIGEKEEDMKLTPPALIHLPTPRRSTGGEANTLSCHDFSLVLSETLQALEESVCVPPTPGRCSISSSIDALILQDLEMTRVRGHRWIR